MCPDTWFNEGMRIHSLPMKAALLIPYLVLVVMLPVTRGERLQKYHFFQLIEAYHPVELSDIPVVGETTKLNHKHLSLFFYPAKGAPKTGNYFPAAHSAIVPETGLPVTAACRHVYMAACSGHSPPLFYSKTVSGLSPPMPSDV